METNNHTIYKRSYVIGLLLIVVSFMIYLFSSHRENDQGLFSQTFFVNYVIAIAYPFLLLFAKLKQEKPRPGISQGCWINAVLLFTISAFSLNMEMSVFAQFPLWLNIYTLTSVLFLLVLPYYNNLPTIFKAVMLFLSGLSLIFSIYMFLYLLPIWPLSCIGLLVMGISIHSFVPAIWLLILVDFYLRKVKDTKLKLWVLPGALVPVLFLIFYLNKWNDIQVEIKNLIAEQNSKLDHQIPDALYLAQKLPSDALTDEILIASFKSQKFWGDNFSLNNNGANKYHNPLSAIAVALFGEIGLDESTVESLLNIRKDYRHYTTDKLWTGISLSTSGISNNIQVFPEYRMAYHEKTFVIHNDPNQNRRDFWFTSETQEALYTFHLPEGSIVTSLSLWINGREEKSRLSTHQKADSAYTNIVGVQNRDPAIVHWQEGNKITVNIFPCTTKEDRKFKIGFTTPLKADAETLCLENIWFEGPDGNDARESTHIIVKNAKDLISSIPKEFILDANGNYEYQGDYKPYWEIKFKKAPLSKNTFCFGGHEYSLLESKSEVSVGKFENVFLEVTNQWTKDEFEEVINKLNSKNIYAWLPEKTLISETNKEIVWDNVSKNQFSIPFLYDISQPENSIVITKTSYRSPVLSDLKNSTISDNFTNYFSKMDAKIKVLNIGEEESAFWQTLRELRLIDYEKCSKEKAISKVLTGQLNKCQEDSSSITIYDSGLLIKKEVTADSLKRGNAPDHLLRVFAFNDILRRIGKSYFEKEKYEDVLFREAEEAYVVTPITSMIVLESEKDYKSMGIDENKNTVGNSGILSGGAVPEPHEWVLIGLMALFILRYLIKKRSLHTIS